MFCEKGVLRNFTKFKGNTCARVSLLIQLQASGFYSFTAITFQHSLKQKGNLTDTFLWGLGQNGNKPNTLQSHKNDYEANSVVSGELQLNLLLDYTFFISN